MNNTDDKIRLEMAEWCAGKSREMLEQLIEKISSRPIGDVYVAWLLAHALSELDKRKKDLPDWKHLLEEFEYPGM